MKQRSGWGGVPVGASLTINLKGHSLHAREEASHVANRAPSRNDVRGHRNAPVSPDAHRRRGEFCRVWAALYRGAVGPKHEEANRVSPLIHPSYQCRRLAGGEV